MSCCAAGTNRCLDLRCCAFLSGERVSAEWSRCPCSLARRARDNVTPLRRSSVSWMPARISSLSTGVRRRHAVTLRKASLMTRSMRRCGDLALASSTGVKRPEIQSSSGFGTFLWLDTSWLTSLVNSLSLVLCAPFFTSCETNGVC